MSVEKKGAIDIIVPPSVTEASATALKLCELFIEALLSASNPAVIIHADAHSKSVDCSDQKIREIIKMFVGAGRLDLFSQQMTMLLHETSRPDVIGELKCVWHGSMRQFAFFKGKKSGLSWEIRPC